MSKTDNNQPAINQASQIEHIKTGDLIPYARNSRTHSEMQVAQVAASIKEFGFTNPVLIDKDNVLIAGHGRVMAAQKLGLEQVPCIRLCYLTEAQKKAYVIADNKLALNAGWDDEMLALELSELQDLDFDLDLTGFDADELNELFNFDADENEDEKQESSSGNKYLTISFSVDIKQKTMLEKTLKKVMERDQFKSLDKSFNKRAYALELIFKEFNSK